MTGNHSHGSTGVAVGPTPVHLINHTHWDREWFLTHEYTTAWIPALIESLSDLATANSAYEYLFDGQTLVIEDLLDSRPEYRPIVEDLIGKRNLSIGPVYSQPDWRLVSGQLHVRNLLFGTGDAAALGGQADVAWLVDTFGHISQTPQLLAMAGIDAAFVWRGVPEMHPTFEWQGPDGSRVVTVNLFGGYRNLYGVTKTADIAIDRLVAESNKLGPYYGSTPIPLFDGYDLDTEPEDPVRHYEEVGGVPGNIDLQPSSPRTYVDAALAASAGRGEALPVLDGELLSGRFGATFPGTLSTRTYLKVLHHDAEQALQARAEPLAVLASLQGAPYAYESFEGVSRELLKNGVHDCICGVSIDQVHERMDRSYRQLIDATVQSSRSSIDALLAGFAPGRYAVSTAPMPAATKQRVGHSLVRAETGGIGIWPIETPLNVSPRDETVEVFTWQNQHFSAEVDDGGVRIDGRSAFDLVVRVDEGDTYSSEPGAVLGRCSVIGQPVIESTSELDSVVRVETEFTAPGLSIRCTVRFRFDDGPVIHANMDLDSDGTGFRVDLEFETGVEADRALAAMPLDLVERPHVDTHLLPPDLDAELAAVLMGQREVTSVEDFPFHDFVALQNQDRSVAVLAKGLRSYRSSDAGLLSVAVRRSVEWLAKTGLEYRQGDAGPAMYVPGARSERLVSHEVAFAVLPGNATAVDLYAVSEAFHKPPLIVEVISGDTNGATSWQVFEEQLPMAGLELVDGRPLLRLFNPATETRPLSQPMTRLSVRGGELGSVTDAQAKEILNLLLPIEAPTVGDDPTAVAERSVAAEISVVGEVYGLPASRVGASRSKPTAAVLAVLEDRRQKLLADLEDIDAKLATAVDDNGVIDEKARYRLTHQQYVVAREEAEIALSAELNRRLADSDGIVSIPDAADPEIARLGSHLNDLRVKRRIYDYVVQSL
ncbi:MAG: hypothetical protein ACRBK7_26425 [Acidimicrobiales bacterium]